MPFQLPIDKTIVIEGTFREMLITLAKMKISLCTIYGRGRTSLKIIKHDFLKIWEQLQIWGVLNAKILNAKFLIGKALFSTPFKGTENRFSMSCLV